jgi:hypothetical protein
MTRESAIKYALTADSHRMVVAQGVEGLTLTVSVTGQGIIGSLRSGSSPLNGR